MNVRDLMRTGVVTAAPGDDFKELVERMLARRVSCLPVVDGDGHVLGIVSESDLLAVEAFGGEKRGPLTLVSAVLRGQDAWLVNKAASRHARDLMTRRVVCASPDDDARVAARRLLDWAVNHMPVVENGRLVGIISRHDLLQLFRRTDHGIHAGVCAALGDPERSPDDVRVSVSVRHGVVTIVGSVAHPEDSDAVEELVRSVDGVVDVQCDLAVRESEERSAR